MVPRNIENEIVSLAASGEIRLGVIYGVIGADRSDHVQFPCVVHAGHFFAKSLGNLQGQGTYTTARAVDQHLLSGVQQFPIAKVPKGDQAGSRYGCGLFKTDALRFWRQCIFRSGHVLGIGAAAGSLVAAHALADYRITGLKAGHAPAN